MRFPLTILFSLGWLSLALSQVEFNQANHLIHDQKIRSTLSIGLADMNDDYKDDLVLLDQGTDLILAYQSAPGLPFQMHENGSILDNPAWALSLGDLDNDGISEIFACGINTFGNIYKKNPSGNYGFQQLLFGLTFPQNSNMADIDNDGWLDVFICDERAYNDLFLNDGSGGMVYNDYIDMHTIPESDNSGNYGSEWVDFDDDRDIDLFITKCKPAITEPDDPLRINVLFENDGSQHYSENGDKFGLRSGAQSWTGTFGDLDNDGDLDCFVSNHDTTHVIYINMNNDTFVDLTKQWMEPLRSSSIQAAIRDFDNNGFMDIYVTGDIDYMIWNQGNGQMSVEKNPMGLLNVFTFATGDLNDDGFLDIIASHGGLNFAGDYDDVLWLNKANDNHYIKCSFWGVESNRKGVGTKVKLYSDLGVQTRDVRIGESYGTTNSGNVHFGLGSLEQADSMYVYWPSGQVDVYYDIQSNQQYLLHESKCMSPFLHIVYEGDNVLCAGESLSLEVPGGFDQYIWSTGESASVIEIDGETEVSFRGIDENGCVHQSNITKIWMDPDESPEIYFVEGSDINCIGDAVTLTTDPAESYQWSDGEISQTIEVSAPGNYSVNIEGECRSFNSDTLWVDFFEVSPPVLVDSLTVHEVGPIDLVAEGENISWYSDEWSVEAIGEGNVFHVWVDSDTSFYADAFAEHQADLSSVGMAEHMGTALGGVNLNSGLMFNCFHPFVLEQVKVIADEAAFRTIELKQIEEDSGEELLLATQRVFVEEGSQYIDLNFELMEGLHYILTTNADSNLLHLGTKSPALYRSNEGVSFPYTLDGIMEMTTSLHGPSYYYYFFDWQVRPKSISCTSERVGVQIILDTLSHVPPSTEEPMAWIVHPNPALNSLHISPSSTVDEEILIAFINVQGIRCLERWVLPGEEVDLSSLASGLYQLIISSAQGAEVHRQKLVVVD